MSEVVVDTNTLEDIGNAIRAQNGGQELYRPSQMAAAIRSLSNVEVDPTLTVSGAAADARVVGQKFDEDEAAIRRIRGDLEETQDNLDAVSGYQVKNIFRPEWEERTHNGIVWTINNDLTVTIRGQASANEYQSSTFPVKAGTYVLTGCPDGGSEVGYHMLYHDPVTDNAIYETGEGCIITFPEDVEEFQVYIRAKSGTSVANGVTFSPMLRPVEIEDGTYMQYGLIYVEESLAEMHASLGNFASREYVDSSVLLVSKTVMGLAQGISANTQWNVMQNVGASIPYEIIIPDGYKPIMTFISFVYSSYGTCLGRSASINKSAGRWYLMGGIRNYGIQDDVVSGFDVEAICVREA